MKKKLNVLFNFIGEMKVYFGNAGIYLGVANFLMLLATFKLTYKINISAYLVVPLGFLFAIFIGWLDYKLILKHQVKHSNKMNDVKIQLDRIEKQLAEFLDNNNSNNNNNNNNNDNNNNNSKNTNNINNTNNTKI